jgi:hypothetical protein
MDRWLLFSELKSGARRPAVSAHATLRDAIEAAASVWQQGRRPVRIVGPENRALNSLDISRALAELGSNAQLQPSAC